MCHSFIFCCTYIVNLSNQIYKHKPVNICQTADFFLTLSNTLSNQFSQNAKIPIVIQQILFTNPSNFVLHIRVVFITEMSEILSKSW